MTVNEFFGRVCYINLDKRKDRKERVESVLSANNVDALRFHGIEGNRWGWKKDLYKHPMRAFDGMAGCVSTHISILRNAMKDGMRSVLILEDDCEFTPNFEYKFNMWSENVPRDWDLLYLGGMNGAGQYVKGLEEHVVTITGMLSTHAYAVNEKAFKKVIDTWYGSFPYLKESVDGSLCILQNELNAYAFNPPMAWQRADHSDIQNGHRDYVFRFKQPLI